MLSVTAMYLLSLPLMLSAEEFQVLCHILELKQVSKYLTLFDENVESREI